MLRVTAAILIENQKVLIAQRKPTDLLPNKWEFPGGKIECNESAEDCLLREMKEELSIDVKILNFFGESDFQYPDFFIKLIAYNVKRLSGEITLIEHQNYKWVSLEYIDKFDFAAADIPFIQKLKREHKNVV